MFRRSFLAGLAGVAVAGVAAIPAAPALAAAQWVMLGEQTVGLNVDKDVYYVGGDEGRYDALRFRVLGNRVAFAEARVVFGNGSSQVLDVKEHVNAGETTKAYDLKGNHRVIERIEFLYQSEKPMAGKAVVQVYGLKHTGIGPKPGKWEVLGKKEVSFVVDHDVIPVGVGEGTFRSIRFHVTGRPIHLYDIKVRFANGQVQTYAIHKYIPAGSYSPVLDLAGDKRLISRIDLVYKKVKLGGHAYLTVYGRH
jgi:hypothetical protein